MERKKNKSPVAVYYMHINTVLLSFATGFVVGAVFRMVHLPIPAPDNIAGVMGIFGIFAGYVLLRALGL